jgi:nucleoside-diphosphate kinase
MKEHPKFEQTLVIIKPDGVQRTLVGEIIGRYERMGLKLVGIKATLPTPEKVEEHYTLDPNWKRIVGEKAIESYERQGKTPPSSDPLKVGDKVIETLKKYMTSGPVIAMVWQGAHAVEVVRKITGGTEPRTSDVGTIRGDYVLDSYQMADTDDRSIRNLIHASGTVDEAKNEIALWFDKDEIIDYKLVQEQIIYSTNIEGLL